MNVNCYYCKNLTVDNRCLDCKFKYDLRDAWTINKLDIGKPRIFGIELLIKDKIYCINYDIMSDITQVGSISLIDQNYSFVMTIPGFPITPENIKARLPICLLLS